MASKIFNFIKGIIDDLNGPSFEEEYLESTFYKNTKIPYDELMKHYSNRQTGVYGEYLTTKAIEEVAKANFSSVPYRIFNNLIIPRPNDNYAEIDILFITPKRFFVIEVKDRNGVIKNESLMSETWKLSQGSNITEIKNPFVQNDQHISALVNYLYKYLKNKEVPFDVDIHKTEVEYLYNSNNFPFSLNYFKDFYTSDELRDFNFFIWNSVVFSNKNMSFYGFDVGTRKLYSVSTVEDLKEIISDFALSYPIDLSTEEYNTICEALDSISYSYEENELFQKNRNLQFGRKELLEFYTYQLVKIIDGITDYDFTIAKSNGFETWLLDKNDNIFKAFPNVKFRPLAPERKSLDDAFIDNRNYYYSEANKNQHYYPSSVEKLKKSTDKNYYYYKEIQDGYNNSHQFSIHSLDKTKSYFRASTNDETFIVNLDGTNNANKLFSIDNLNFFLAYASNPINNNVKEILYNNIKKFLSDFYFSRKDVLDFSFVLSKDPDGKYTFMVLFCKETEKFILDYRMKHYRKG